MSACYFGKEATLQTGLFEHKLTQAASLRAKWQRQVLPVVEHTPTRPAIKNEGRLRNPDAETTRAPRIQPQAPTRHDLIAHVDAFLHTNWRNYDILNPEFYFIYFVFFVCLFFYRPIRYSQCYEHFKIINPNSSSLGYVRVWWKYVGYPSKLAVGGLVW